MAEVEFWTELPLGGLICSEDDKNSGQSKDFDIPDDVNPICYVCAVAAPALPGCCCCSRCSRALSRLSADTPVRVRPDAAGGARELPAAVPRRVGPHERARGARVQDVQRHVQLLQARHHHRHPHGARAPALLGLLARGKQERRERQ